ncbi:MAG: hypothetical protein AB1404_06170 [Spirochaetota bacterium]
MKQAFRNAFFLVGGLVLLIGLGSCDLLYSGKNLFAGIDGPDVAALKSATGTSLIDKLHAEKGGETGTFGDTFVAKLKDDPEAVDTIYDHLEDIFNSGNIYDADTRAEAASLAADLILATSDTAGPVVDQVVSAILSLTSDPNNTSFSADELAVALLSTIAPDRASFISLVHDMGRIAVAYDALGSALVDGGSASLDAGDGQAALVAFILTGIVDAVQDTYLNPAEALYDQLIGPALAGTLTDTEAADAINSLFSTDITNPNGAANLQAVFDSILNPTNARQNLYEATGIGSLTALLGGN